MFYLIELFNFYKKNVFITLTLSVLTFTSFGLICNFDYFGQKINNYLPKIENQHYFNALISNEVSLDFLKRKISELPGVIGFESVSNDIQKRHIQKLNQEVTLTKEEMAEFSKMVSIKISMTPELNQSSINLIREYMQRLAGSDKVVLGSVNKKLNNEFVFKNIIDLIKVWPLQILIAVTLVFWFVSFLSVRFEMNKIAFIIESFQRKTNVGFKLMFTFMVIHVALAQTVSFVALAPNLYTSLLVFSIAMFAPYALFGKRKWVKA